MSLWKKILTVACIVAWCIAGVVIYFFEINTSYTKSHSAVQNIVGNGVLSGISMCLKPEDQNTKLKKIQAQKQPGSEYAHSLMIRTNRSATCIAMGTWAKKTSPGFTDAGMPIEDKVQKQKKQGGSCTRYYGHHCYWV